MRFACVLALLSSCVVAWAGAPPPPVSEAAQPVTVLVELGQPSAIQMSSHDALAQVATSQRDLIAELASERIASREIYRLQRVLNGIALEVNRADLPRIGRLPGVKRVHELHAMAPDLAGSVPLIGVPWAWSPSGAGVTGRGVRIGIIDSGIDYRHVTFGGDGVYGSESYTDSVVPWNAKVAGGVDLAGDDYDSSSSDAARRAPKPDGDPMDCMGHGTIVASIAAGYGVQGESAYRGPYDAAINAGALALAPGVAPEAELYAIRVFGCSGTTMLAPKAIEWAVDPNGDGNFSDHLDVVNLSIGADFLLGTADVLAANAAVAAGVIVVGSAGNSGDTYFIADGVGAATRAISVANSLNQQYRLDGFHVDAPASIAGTYAGQTSSAYAWPSMTPVSGEVVRPLDQSTGCSPFSASDAARLAGKIALLDWTSNGCGTAARTTNAAGAGAIGVIFVDDRELLEATGIAGTAQIPAVRTTRATGETLKLYAGSGLRVTLAKTWLGTQSIDYAAQTDVISPDSSRGPRIGDALLKPDLSAPGGPIFGARVKGGTLGESGSGTSLAAPHVTGAVALLRELHPQWTAEEIKAALINSASGEVHSSADHAQPDSGLGRTGAGRMNVADAATLDVLAIAENPAGAVSISFGVVEITGDTRADARFRIVNKDTSPVTLTMSFVPDLTVPGIAFSFPGGETVTVPAQSSVTSSIRLSAIAAAIEPRRDPSVAATVDGISRHWITETGGHIVFASPSTTLRLPVYAVIRPSGSRHVTEQILEPASRVSLGVSGAGVAAMAVAPIVTVFEWHYVSGNDASTSADLADIRYVGVTSDAKAVAASSTSGVTIVFGIATHHRWCTPNVTSFNIDIDVGADGTPDFVLYTASGSPADTLSTAICPRPTGACFWNVMPRNIYRPSQIETAPFFSDVVAIPVRASDVGLSSTTRFAYRVSSFAYTGAKVWAAVDATPWLTYDVAHPALSFPGAVWGSAYLDRGDYAIPMDYDAAAAAASSFRGVLLLHSHNTSGRRAEAVPFRGATETKRRGVRH